MASTGINPVLALVTKADSLAGAFRQFHKESTAPVQSLEQLYHAGQLNEDTVEGLLALVRDKLGNMETCVEEMMNLLYQVDVYLSDPATQLKAGFNPKEGLDHVSAAVHSYQTELLGKRELLADFTSEDIDVSEFASRWISLDEIQAGNKQDVDSLADLLAGFS